MSDQSKSGLTREISIFDAALKLSAPAERAAFLDRECGGDASLRAAVESLLKHHKDDHFMAKPGGTARLSPVTEKPGDMIGRYKLMEQIGEGGFGVVYVAEQREPVRRMVALKISKLGMDTRQVVARFEAERQALAMMDHPNIAKVLDGGATDSGRPYFVMELVRGVKVTEYCDQKKLTTRERLDLFMQICRAVQHAHQKGVIHRDIKPSNILVTLHDGVPVPKVIDFGIAKATQGHLTDKTIYTEFQQFMGTPAYMSPEQAEMSGLDIDTRSDLYSLGVLLYELLTGSPPFEEKALLACGLDEMRRTIREKEPPRPSTRLGDLTPDDLTTTARRHGTEPPKLLNLVRGDLDWIVMKCLEKDRSRRYESASGVAADIERHLNNEPIVARPPSSVYRLQKMVRRNKLAFAAGTAVAVSVLIGLGVSSWLLVKERQARQLAAAAEAKALDEARRATRFAELESVQRHRADIVLESARNLLAYSLHDSGQFDKAMVYLTKNLSMIPTNEAALSHLATLLVYYSTFTPARPNAYFTPCVSLESNNSTFTPPRVAYSDIDCCLAFDPNGLKFSANEKCIVCSYAIGWGWMRYCRSVVRPYPEPTMARRWDAETGRPTSPPITNKDSDVPEFSPNGNRLLSFSTNGTATLWDAESGQPLLPPITNAGDVTNEWQKSSHFSHDGKRFLLFPSNGVARLWNAETGHPVSPPITNADVHGTQFSSDGKRLLVFPSNGFQVWDAETGRLIGQPMTNGEYNPYVSPTSSPDGKRLLFFSTNGSARLWNADTGQPLSSPITNTGEYWAQNHGPKFSPDGKELLLFPTNAIQVWDLETGNLKWQLITNEDYESAEWSPDSQRIVTLSTNETLLVRDARTGRSLGRPITNQHVYLDLKFSPNGKTLFLFSGRASARLLDVETGQVLKSLTSIGTSVVENLPNSYSGLGGWAEFSLADSALAVCFNSVNDDAENYAWHAAILDSSTGQTLEDLDGNDGRSETIVESKKFVGAWHEPRSLLITSHGWPNQVCELYPKKGPCPNWVLKLAEVVSGLVLDDDGQLEKTKLDRVQTVNDIRAKLNKDPSEDDWTVWGRWLLADPDTRCLSPFYARNRREGLASHQPTNKPAP